MRVLKLVSVLLLFILSFSNPASAEQDVAGIIQSLKYGGYVVYFRHEKTERKKVAKSLVDKNEYLTRKKGEPCKTQRNINEIGKKSAKVTGEALKKLNIRYSKVLSSPFCRCVDTARLITGQDPEISNDLVFTLRKKKADREKFGERLRNILSTPPQSNSNTFLFSHNSSLKEAANIWTNVEGVAHVFQPQGNGKFKYIGYILPSDWKKAAGI